MFKKGQLLYCMNYPIEFVVEGDGSTVKIYNLYSRSYIHYPPFTLEDEGWAVLEIFCEDDV